MHAHGTKRHRHKCSENFIHNFQKLETAQMSIIINKLLQIHTMEYHLAMKRMNEGYGTRKWINL